MSGSFQAKKWMRFPQFEQGDYFYMSDMYWDAVMVQPRSDIYFLGFGLMNQYEKKTFKVIFKYNIEGTDSAEYETEFTQDMLGEDKFFEVDFQKLNVPVVQVKAEEKLHIIAKI